VIIIENSVDFYVKQGIIILIHTGTVGIIAIVAGSL
jgi:hypothetical protein